MNRDKTTSDRRDACGSRGFLTLWLCRSLSQLILRGFSDEAFGRRLRCGHNIVTIDPIWRFTNQLREITVSRSTYLQTEQNVRITQVKAQINLQQSSKGCSRRIPTFSIRIHLNLISTPARCIEDVRRPDPV